MVVGDELNQVSDLLAVVKFGYVLGYGSFVVFRHFRLLFATTG